MTKKILQLLVVLFITVQGVMGQTVSVVSLTNASPGDIEVEVDMDGYTDVGAITLYIEYDSDLLDFNGITNTSLAGTWLANAATTDLIIVTYNTDGASNSPSGKLFDLQFYNNGGFSSDIIFDEANCEIADQDLNTITTTYTDGEVTQGASVGTVSIGTATGVYQGLSFYLPVTFEGTGFSAVDAFTLMISYDATELFFTGLANNTLSGTVVDANNGVISITWNSVTAEDFTTSTDVFDLEFTYNGVGSSIVSFIPGCEVSSSLTPLATTYENGIATPYDSPYELIISDVAASSDSVAVTVPVVASGFTGVTMIGGITLNIAYSDSLTYTGYTAVQGSGWVVSGNSNNVISLTMSVGAGFDLEDGNLVTLDFMYDYDGGGIADIAFEEGSEMVAAESMIIVPISYTDGSVQQGFSVSGVLKYANTTGDARPISNSTVYLKTSDGSSIVSSTTTDNDGNYSFEGVVNGDYMLDASTSKSWAGTTYVNFDDAIDVYTFWQTGSPALTGLFFTAGDVNTDGFVNFDDAIDIYSRWQTGIIPGTWSAPDWVFDNPTINVSSANVTQDITTLCSGDVNASYDPIP